MRLANAWTAIDRLSVIWKSDLTDKMKHSFFQAAVVSILLYGCTTWTLTKHMEKKLDSNYTRMLRAILNKSWRQYLTKQQLYGHLPLIMKTIKIRWSRHVLIWDIALRTCRKQWMIGRGGEIKTGISVLIVRHDDNEIDMSGLN